MISTSGDPYSTHSRYMTIKGQPYTLQQLQELKGVDPLEYQKLQNQAQKELNALELNVTNPDHMARYHDKIDFAFGNGDGELIFSEQMKLKKGVISQKPALHNLPFIGGSGDETVI